MLDVFRKELGEIKSDRQSLRGFGLVMFVALAGVSALALWKSDWTWTRLAITLASVSVIFGLSALATPSLLRPVHRVWMGIAIVLGFVMTRVILTAVFVLVVTPTGILLRILGKDPLTKGPDSSLDSYWIAKEYRTRDRERFEKYY